MIKRKLHLMNLPEKTTFVILEKNYNKKFFNIFLSNFPNIYQASKFLNIDHTNLARWMGKRMEKNKEKVINSSIPLKAIIKILKFLKNQNYYTKNIEQNIIALKYGRGKPLIKPKFPINLESKEFAIIVSALLCDGGINKKGKALYNNSELCMREKIVKNIESGIGKIEIDPSKPYLNNSIVFPKILTSILEVGFNMQIGDKVINNPKIPNLILTTNKKGIIGEFLNQAFSDDGTIYINSKNKQGTIAYGTSIDITKIDKKIRDKIKKENREEYCSNLVKGCKLLLNKLNIKVNGPYCKKEYIRKKGGKIRYIHSWSIQIQGKENVKKFKKWVNFSIPEKSKRIDKILNNYTEIGYKVSFEDSLKRIKRLSKKNKVINTKNLMKDRKCTLENARYLLKELRKKGYLRKIGGGHIKGKYSCYPYEYKLIEPKSHQLSNQLSNKF